MFGLTRRPGAFSPVGAALSLSGAFVYGLYFPLLRQLQRGTTATVATFYIAIGTCLSIVAYAALRGELAWTPTASSVGAMTWLAIVPTVVAFQLILRGLVGADGHGVTLRRQVGAEAGVALGHVLRLRGVLERRLGDGGVDYTIGAELLLQTGRGPECATTCTDTGSPSRDSPSGTTGGKNVYVDRVEWNLALRDAQAQLSALQKGEVDIIEALGFDQYEAAKGDASIQMPKYSNYGLQYMARFNHLHKPFDNPKVRQAALAAFAQEPFLRAQVGVKALYKTCPSMFICGTPFGSATGSEIQSKGRGIYGRKLIKKSGLLSKHIRLEFPTLNVKSALLPTLLLQVTSTEISPCIHGAFKVSRF